jgi:hypothetical protein
MLAGLFLCTVGLSVSNEIGALRSYPGVRPLLAVAPGLVIVWIALFRRDMARLRFEEEQYAATQRRVEDAFQEVTKRVDFPSLLRLNQTQIDRYHGITTDQAERSFRNSQLAMGVGLAFLTAGATIVFVAPDPASKIAVGAISSVAGALSGYIGATFLKAYNATLDQLNYYFRQPLTNSYLLSAERLVGDPKSARRC